MIDLYIFCHWTNLRYAISQIGSFYFCLQAMISRNPGDVTQELEHASDLLTEVETSDETYRNWREDSRKCCIRKQS